ncbi:hypothetical protein GCM10010329_19590 [Streptomyces spiroverticillatus]|uniref:Uncharacterized protein n=1 Tax=Streptomyces finlayi TaxID=67296 RepID=A0A919C840_9ACTN|nr:hypothetical protein [Streptomyces finlayi]GGZ98249.1 hypothetical protein GCM10010329_19590 [Streptomyces spiroverticillatus]GHC83182.1 hypothetical protein GCM10010334_12030 [Streptomyces finlayi]
MKTVEGRNTREKAGRALLVLLVAGALAGAALLPTLISVLQQQP